MHTYNVTLWHWKIFFFALSLIDFMNCAQKKLKTSFFVVHFRNIFFFKHSRCLSNNPVIIFIGFIIILGRFQSQYQFWFEQNSIYLLRRLLSVPNTKRILRSFKNRLCVDFQPHTKSRVGIRTTNVVCVYPSARTKASEQASTQAHAYEANTWIHWNEGKRTV